MSNDMLESYLTLYSEKETEGLKELYHYTMEYGKGARMISGPLQGAFLMAMSLLKQPKNILEIGTFTGYSALCLAQGLVPEGSLITIDVDQHHQETFEAVWRQDSKGQQIKFIQGAAASIIPNLSTQFDLVFIDADKAGYETYMDLVLPKMPPGGVILADNVLFRNEVFLPQEEQSKTAKHMHAFNQKVKVDDRVMNVILPLRDGINLIVKK